jgi:hypothetical protein
MALQSCSAWFVRKNQSRPPLQTLPLIPVPIHFLTARSRPVAITCVALALSVSALAADAHTVLAAQQQRMQTADYRVAGRLVQVDAKGARTSYGLTIKAHWFPGVLQILLDVTSPATARERVLLEMKPNGQDTILVAHPGDAAATALPFARWADGPLGTAFSYEDFLEPEYFWSGQTVLREERRGARDCSVVKSTPSATARTHYAEVQSWLDKTIGSPIYVEKTLKGSGALKEFTYMGLRHDGGVWSASQVEAVEHGKPGSTLLIVDRGSAKANLSPADFSMSAMTHFQGGI